MADSPKSNKTEGCIADASSRAGPATGNPVAGNPVAGNPVAGNPVAGHPAPFGAAFSELDAFSRATASLSKIWKSSSAAVALSGGADSAMLAVVADQVARQRGATLHLLHVNHGLLPQASSWATRVQDLARRLDRPIDILEVDVGSLAGRGMEAAARDARYAALLAACERHGVPSLLLAHHQDDQAETVLLRLLRGAGVSGLAAMAPSLTRGHVQLLRPWLKVARADILEIAQSFAHQTGWHAVNDPTNSDPRYTRAAVRTLLAPVLNDRWPGWQSIVGRHAEQAQEAASILQEVAGADLAAIAVSQEEGAHPGGSKAALVGCPFLLLGWRQLSEPRQRNVLRHWLAECGAQMPSEARLRELQRQFNQLHSLGHDRNLVFNHGELRVRCVRGVVFAQSRSD